MFDSKILTVTASKEVEKIDIRLTGNNFTGTLWITDLMLQGGSLATIWTGHVSEILWTYDQA